jgi:hypothetical protein
MRELTIPEKFIITVTATVLLSVVYIAGVALFAIYDRREARERWRPATGK